MPTHNNAYLTECGPDFVTIASNSARTDRRVRASRINAHRRWFEQTSGVKLVKISASYSETPGFLSRSSFRYRVYRGTHRGTGVTSGPTVYVGRH
jgi:hypothetical protein